jgi:hypothetical protein
MGHGSGLYFFGGVKNMFEFKPVLHRCVALFVSCYLMSYAVPPGSLNYSKNLILYNT